MPFSIALPIRLVCKNDAKISGKSDSNSTSRSGAGAEMGSPLLMEDDDQPMRRTLESTDVLGNHRQQAFAAVFARDRHHVLGSVPKGVSDPSDTLSVWLEDLAIDDVLHKELGTCKRLKCCAWQVDLLSNQDGSGFSRCDCLEANEQSDLHATAY